MQTSRLTTATALRFQVLFAVLCLGACRSAHHEPAVRSGALQLDPCLAAKEFFSRHYDFYYEDPVRCEALLTPRFFQILKHHYEAFERTRLIGALDCDPWTNAQDGEVSKPYSFTTVKVLKSEAVVQFEYTFALGPGSRTTQCVFLKLQRSAQDAPWRVSDLVMPHGASLVDLLERNP